MFEAHGGAGYSILRALMDKAVANPTTERTSDRRKRAVTCEKPRQDTRRPVGRDEYKLDGIGSEDQGELHILSESLWPMGSFSPGGGLREAIKIWGRELCCLCSDPEALNGGIGLSNAGDP